MEILILFGMVVVPLFAIALFAMYKERQEKRKEQQMDLQTQHS
jgi:preprotein translocase subunit YajC